MLTFHHEPLLEALRARMQAEKLTNAKAGELIGLPTPTTVRNLLTRYTQGTLFTTLLQTANWLAIDIRSLIGHVGEICELKYGNYDFNYQKFYEELSARWVELGSDMNKRNRLCELAQIPAGTVSNMINTRPVSFRLQTLLGALTLIQEPIESFFQYAADAPISSSYEQTPEESTADQVIETIPPETTTLGFALRPVPVSILETKQRVREKLHATIYPADDVVYDVDLVVQSRKDDTWRMMLRVEVFQGSTANMLFSLKTDTHETFEKVLLALDVALQEQFFPTLSEDVSL